MGFDRRRFDTNVDEELICPICSDVLQKPTEITVCGHVFCCQCLDQWLRNGQNNCPFDRRTIRTSDLKTPRIVNNLVSKLNINCDFSEFGCKEVIQLERLPEHIKECHFNPNKPLKCEKGCSLMILRRDYNQHNCLEELHSLVKTQSNEIDCLKTELMAIKVDYQRITNDVKEVKQKVEELSAQKMSSVCDTLFVRGSQYSKGSSNLSLLTQMQLNQNASPLQSTDSNNQMIYPTVITSQTEFQNLRCIYCGQIFAEPFTRCSYCKQLKVRDSSDSFDSSQNTKESPKPILRPPLLNFKRSQTPTLSLSLSPLPPTDYSNGRRNQFVFGTPKEMREVRPRKILKAKRRHRRTD